MADIVVRLGAVKHKVKWPVSTPVELALAEPIIRHVLTDLRHYIIFDLDYIGGWSWLIKFDGRTIGSVAIITDVQ